MKNRDVRVHLKLIWYTQATCNQCCPYSIDVCLKSVRIKQSLEWQMYRQISTFILLV
jgi:hypothetical protein